ncbi:MAG: hypothetical protein EU529_16800 [Promethearchaeota archaeon]|nr:MAG: hypothetical protein EU529_16800 [Candidatus Lokiarchaeota archaeon]
MMKKLRRTNPSKKKRKKIIISPEKKKVIQEHLQDIKNSIRIFFFNINASISRYRDKMKNKQIQRQNKKHHKNILLTLSKKRFENGSSIESPEITIKTTPPSEEIKESVNLIDCDLEIRERLADLFQDIQKSDDFNDVLMESSNIKKKKLKKKSKDPHFQLTKQIYQKYIELEEKLDQIASTTESIKDDTFMILIDVSQLAKIIEIAIDDITNIEEYMKNYLGSDWQKIKHSWEKYKDKEITKGEFVKSCLRAVGLKFVNIFIRTK